MADIVRALEEALVEVLTDALIHAVAEDDPSRVKLVLHGDLMDDKELYSPWVEIHHIQGVTAPMVPQQDWGVGGSQLQFVEIGGGSQGWAHRFEVKVSWFMIGQYDRETAHTMASDLRQRVKDALLDSFDLEAAADDGEYHMGSPQVIQRYATEESGGPPREWIHTTRFFVEYLTIKP